MKRLSLNFFLLIFPFFLFSQNKKLDSLWAVYHDKSQADTNRCKALQTIAWSLRFNNPDTAILLAEEELALAQTLSPEMGKTWIARSYNAMGASYLNKANYPKALDYYLKTQKLFEELGDKLGVGKCYANLITLYQRQAMYPKSLEYGFKAIHIFEALGSKKDIGNCYQNIGASYQYQLNYSKALEYYLKALPICEQSGSRKAVSGCNNNIGLIYKEQADYPKALQYDLTSLQIAKENGDQEAISFAYGNMADLYNRWKNYKISIQYSDSELVICKETGDIEGEREAYQNLADAFAKTGKYKEAYEAHVKNKLLTDSIFNEQNSQQLSDLKTNFEVERKEAELNAKAELQQTITEAQHNKKQLIAIFIVLLIIVIAVLMLNRQKLKSKKDKIIFEQQEALLRSEKQKVEEELVTAKKLLTNYTENLIEKNNAIEAYQSEIEKLKGLKSTEIYNEKIDALDDLNNATILTNEDWDKFKELFDQVYKGFFIRLKEKFTVATNAETRLMSLIKLNLDTKQMASMLGVSPDTITKTRYRLKKKLNLAEGDSLEKVVEAL